MRDKTGTRPPRRIAASPRPRPRSSAPGRVRASRRRGSRRSRAALSAPAGRRDAARPCAADGRAGCVPVTAKPSASSAPSALCPPISTAPASSSTSVPPFSIWNRSCSMIAGSDGGSVAIASAVSGTPAHRINVAERVVGGDAPEQIRVLDHRAEEIDGLQERRRARKRHDRRVVGAAEPERHGRFRRRIEPRDRARQHLGRNLGGAAAAAHRALARRVGLLRHERQVGVFPHPAPVDPVLEPPQAASVCRERSARGDGPPVAGADQRQRALLRHGATQATAGQRPPQIVGERRPGAHRIDAGLLARVGRHRRDVAGGEHRLVAPASAASRRPRRKPRSSSGRPVSASHGAPPASVTHSASSNAIVLPSAAISRPGSTDATGVSVSTRMPRSFENAGEQRPARARLCDGSKPSRVTKRYFGRAARAAPPAGAAPRAPARPRRRPRRRSPAAIEAAPRRAPAAPPSAGRTGRSA